MATKLRLPTQCRLPLLPRVTKELPMHIKLTKKTFPSTQERVQKLFCKGENAFLTQERGQSNS